MDILLKEPDAKAHVEVMKTNEQKLSMTGTDKVQGEQIENLGAFSSLIQP